MISRTQTFWLAGLDARRVEVEAHTYKGTSSFKIVGLADRAVQEARERVRSGVMSARFEFPSGRLVVNLAPAQERKEGAGFDLAIALAVLAASRQAPRDRVAAIAAVAEVGLDGSLRPVRGALAVAHSLAGTGVEGLLMAPENAAEAALVSGVPVMAARTLNEAVDILWGKCEPAPLPPLRTVPGPGWPDLGDVRGQARARRALEIAAVGDHNLLMSGPPGSGKTLLARRLGGILTAPSTAEMLEISRIHSAAGLLAPACTPTAARFAPRITARRLRRWWAARACAPARWRWRTVACSSWTSCRSSHGRRSRRCASRSRRGGWRSPGRGAGS